MEQSQILKPVYAATAVLLIAGIAVVVYINFRGSPKDSNLPNTSVETTPENVVVTYTPPVNGTLSAPVELPQSIPFEKNKILESVTTDYPDQNARQFSISYTSVKTVVEKYAEYKSYMGKEGYTVEEGDMNSPVRAIFGQKTDANLSVAISSSGGQTLVQLSYLLKSVSK